MELTTHNWDKWREVQGVVTVLEEDSEKFPTISVYFIRK